MKTKTLFIFSLFCFCFCQQINSQVPVPEEIFDLYDDDENENEGENNSQNQGLGDINLDQVKEILDATGALGAFPSSAISSGRMVSDDCERTYICMYNTLKKVLIIAEYEEVWKHGVTTCEEEKALLQNYAMYLLTLNLDIYCVEHLHPDSNELNDVELINTMLAMRDVYFDFIEGDYTFGKENLPMLFSYSHIRSIADPFCSENLFEIDDSTGALPCECGTYTGTLDLTEKNKLLQDIRTIIDDINPLWQTQKAIEINNKLKTLPCNN